MPYSNLLKYPKGKNLDVLGLMVGVTRKKYFKIFKESDEKYRKRILNALNELPKV